MRLKIVQQETTKYRWINLKRVNLNESMKSLDTLDVVNTAWTFGVGEREIKIILFIVFEAEANRKITPLS